MCKLIDLKTKVQNWIDAGCQYNQGVVLYAEIGKNKSLKRLFPGKEHRYAGKLRYELGKLVALEPKPEPASEALVFEGEPKVLPSTFSLEASENDPPQGEASEYPPVIRRLIMAYAELFQARSKAHSLMVQLGDSNAQSVQAKRKELFDLVKALSVRLEALFAARKAYEKNGEIPDEQFLWPEQKKKRGAA